MSEIRFVLKAQPQRTTLQEKGISVIKSGDKIIPKPYTPGKVRNAKDYYIIHLHKHSPKEPLKGAISLRIVFHFKTETKRGWKVTKPDVDNMAKLFIDAMTETGFWKDDNQIACLGVAKRWDAEDMIEVEVRQLGLSII